VLDGDRDGYQKVLTRKPLEEFRPRKSRVLSNPELEGDEGNGMV
jgi:hypothetical protein